MFAKRVAISGAFAFLVDCSPPFTSWSSTVAGANGLFAAGAATVTASAAGCDFSCGSADASRTIRLRPAR